MLQWIVIASLCVGGGGFKKNRFSGPQSCPNGNCSNMQYVIPNTNTVGTNPSLFRSEPIKAGEIKTSVGTSYPDGIIKPTTIVENALAEVNARRAARGLKAFVADEGLRQAALACAKIRAASLIDGHLGGPSGDFAYLPAGTTASAAGCGALEDSWGWGTCCMDEDYTYAGAAWVRGSNGKRYMHLFVRK